MKANAPTGGFIHFILQRASRALVLAGFLFGATAALAQLDSSSDNGPTNIGTFGVMTIGPDDEPAESPNPFLPPNLSAVSIYSVAGDIYMVDDTGGQLLPSSNGQMSNAQATSTLQAQAQIVASFIERGKAKP